MNAEASAPDSPGTAGRRAELLDSSTDRAASDVTPRGYSSLEQACAVEYPRLVRLLTLYCGDRDVALDLAQETLARGCAHWPAVHDMGDQRAWFTRVALNLANSRWRRLRVERRIVAVIGVRGAAPPGFDPTETLAVRAAVAGLPDRQRAAIVLRYFDDLDLAATAAVMRCSTGTVKKLTARGIAGLRNRLGVDIAADEEDNGG
jgi:DNA-directed RNA polymerase specialized sigma24 family protein